MRVAMLTGGGDCPGLNAVIRAIVRKGEMHHGDELIGFLDAWEGILDHRAMALNVRTLRGMLPKGGTLLGTTRRGPNDSTDGVARVKVAFDHVALDARSWTRCNVSPTC